MSAETERHALDEGRAFAVARLTYRLGERIQNGEWVVAVHLNTGHAVAGRTIGDALEFHGVVGGRHLREEVVLADEDDRQVPQSGHVRGLVEGPRVRRAVTEADDGYAVDAFTFGRHRQPHRDGRSSADNARREHHARLGFGD